MPEASKRSNDLTGFRILIVEDEYLIAMELAEHVEALGAEVAGPAMDAKEALAIIGGDQALDGAVLDIVLRGDKVFAVAEALRERGIPFVFMSGFGPEAVPSLYGNYAFCPKPADPSAVVEALLLQTRSKARRDHELAY